jgi:hypothetical protein
MRKFGVVGVGRMKQSKRFALLCNKSKKNENLGCLVEEKVEKK